MINQYKNSDIKIYGDTGVLEYYSLNGIDEWAFLGYSALTFVFFFLVAYIVSPPPPPPPARTRSGIFSYAMYHASQANSVRAISLAGLHKKAI